MMDKHEDEELSPRIQESRFFVYEGTRSRTLEHWRRSGLAGDQGSIKRYDDCHIALFFVRGAQCASDHLFEEPVFRYEYLLLKFRCNDARPLRRAILFLFF